MKLYPDIMIRPMTICILCMICFLTIGCSSENQVKPLKPLHVATGNWEPFVGKNLPHHGPLAEMLSAILVDLHYVPEFKFYDWPMAEIHLESGYPSIAFPYIKSQERIDKGFRFSMPLLKFKYVLFYHKDRYKKAKSITSLNELKNIQGRIGLVRGYAKIPDTPSRAYREISSTIAGFNQLRDGKIDYLLESKNVGLGLLESQYLPDDKNDFMYLGQPDGPHAPERLEFISEVALRIMLSPKLKPSILADINEAIMKNKDTVFFQSLERLMKTNANSLDTGFIDTTDNETIYGYFKSSSSKAGCIIPRNSKVLITEWGTAYFEQAKNSYDETGAGRSRVKMLNGPLKGKVMWVNNQHLIIER